MTHVGEHRERKGKVQKKGSGAYETCCPEVGHSSFLGSFSKGDTVEAVRPRLTPGEEKGRVDWVSFVVERNSGVGPLAERPGGASLAGGRAEKLRVVVDRSVLGGTSLKRRELACGVRAFETGGGPLPARGGTGLTFLGTGLGWTQ